MKDGWSVRVALCERRRQRRRPEAPIPGAARVAWEGASHEFGKHYADRNTVAGTGEFMPTPDVALSIGVFTRSRVERIAVAAFELARRGRRHVTIVHKANVLPPGMGLFRDVCREVGARYADVGVHDLHMDAMTVHLLRRAGDFDVIVTENMIGDILSDLTGELAGSLGTAPSLNSSDSRAVAQAAHGSAPDITGQDVADPVAMMLSAGMLLEWLGTRHDDPGLLEAASRLSAAVRDVVAAGTCTPDLGGTASTTTYTDAVLTALADRSHPTPFPEVLP